MAGTALQFIVGNVPVEYFAYPWSLIYALNYAYVIILLSIWSKRVEWLRECLNEKSAIATMAVLLLMILLMGLTGRNIVLTWPFVLFLFWWMTQVGVTTANDFSKFHRIPKTALLFHLSVFLFLAASFWGFADKQRLNVLLWEGSESCEGVDENGRVRILPFSIRLQDFQMKEYAPQLCLWNESRAHEEMLRFAVDDTISTHTFSSNSIRVLRYLEDAFPNDDNQSFKEFKHIGSVHAALVEIVCNRDTTKTWVSSESFMFERKHTYLNKKGNSHSPQIILEFAPTVPKEYASQVVVTDKDGKRRPQTITVNHPMRCGAWQIYQKSYDIERGRWSSYSVFDCVRDPWNVVTYFSLWLLLLAGVVAVVEVRIKKNKP